MTSFKVLNPFIKSHTSCHNFCLIITKLDNDFQVVFIPNMPKDKFMQGATGTSTCPCFIITHMVGGNLRMWIILPSRIKDSRWLSST
jgi:hypothetical protein